MNTNILQKCIDELKKPRPNKDYILGMLEAMVDMGETPMEKPGNAFTRAPFTPVAKEAPTSPSEVARADAGGEVETPEQRKERLGKRKVPPAFLGNIDKMHLDPSKYEGKTDVVPAH